MYRARTIGKQATSTIICAVILLVASGWLHSFFQNVKGTDQYFWSSEFRHSVSSLSQFATIGMIVGVILLVLGIFMLSIKNTGKVCPQCELVYFDSTARCPKCGVDMTHAKKVDEYLAENPVTPSTSSTDNTNVSDINHEKEKSSKRFCGKCGHEIHSEDDFCTYCGKQQ